MNKQGLIGSIVIVVVLLVVGFFWFVSNWESEEDLVCVPASCCHADSCVLESETPDCDGTICTMNCEPGTMDCGQGHCEYIDGECEVVFDE
jgi:hypothetical protein